MDWDKANSYCKESGGQLPTPTVDEAQFLRNLLVEIGMFSSNLHSIQISVQKRNESFYEVA